MTDSITSFLTETAQKHTEWLSKKYMLADKNKTVSENMTSLAVLQKNDFADKLQEVASSIEAQQSELKLLSTEFESLSTELTQIRSTIKDMLKRLLDTYKLLKLNQEMVGDEVMTDAARVLYDKLDNFQLRADPPINDIFKDESRITTEANPDTPLGSNINDKTFCSI